jgi:hypothetical protein
MNSGNWRFRNFINLFRIFTKAITMTNFDRRRFLQAGAGVALIPGSLSGLLVGPVHAGGVLVKQILTHTDFSGISLAANAIVKPNPVIAEDGATPAIGPGYDSSAVTGLSLPMTAQYQYNVNYWSVIQCGANQASLWINGWGYHLAKDIPGVKSLSGYHLAIGGGRGLTKVWDVQGQYLQFNHVETVQTSYHLNQCLTQAYNSMFFYCPGMGGLPAKAFNMTVPSWASSNNGYFREGAFGDGNTVGVGMYVSALLNPQSRYLTPWSGSLAFGFLGHQRLIGFNITKANMQNILEDWCRESKISDPYYRNPANWYFNGSAQQIEMMWPDAVRPAQGGPMPGQCGVRYSGIEVNIFRS